MVLMNMEYIEELPGGYRLIQDDNHFRLCIDSILLSAFCNLKRGMRVCDLGCGSGAITFILAGMETSSVIDGIDILPSACRLAERNVELNSLGDRVRILGGDIREIKKHLHPGEYDMVVSNPPYFKAGSGAAAKGENRAAARAEDNLTVDELCRAASYLLKWGGSFCVVYRTERMTDMMCALRQNGLEPKRLRFITHRAGQVPGIFMLEARRGGNSGLTLMPELVIIGNDGEESDEVKAIYERG